MQFDSYALEVLDALRARGTHRQMRVLDGAQGTRMRVDGRDVHIFAGSNYLDLAHHPEVTEAAALAAQQLGCAAGGSRLINGNLDIHEALERELAAFCETQAALAFGSGYMANVGVIPALAKSGDVVISDSLSHASIIDGCRLSRADVRVFPHGDLDGLEDVLREVASTHRHLLVAVDGVYSMDGDVAPLGELVPLAKRWGATVLVDDAHGIGTLGDAGRGAVEYCGIPVGEGGADIVLGTLGKSLGSFGAFVAGSELLRELLVNTARSFVFSCALAPPQVAAARKAIELIEREPWRRRDLARNATRLRDGLRDRGISTEPSETHIVPVIIGSNQQTMAVCERLLAGGYYAQGIRHPSVPEGLARLRLTVMATHQPDEIDGLVSLIATEMAALGKGAS
jgi:8-amino-7-oxononanoate synthase